MRRFIELIVGFSLSDKKSTQQEDMDGYVRANSSSSISDHSENVHRENDVNNLQDDILKGSQADLDRTIDNNAEERKESEQNVSYPGRRRRKFFRVSYGSTRRRIALANIMSREFQRIATGKIYRTCMVGAPLFCLVFFLSLMWNGLPVNMPVAVVDMDNTHMSRALSRQLDAFGQSEVVMRTASFADARIKMQEGEVYGILLIPRDFTVDASSGKQPKISIYTNNSLLVAGSLLYKDMKTMANLASAAVLSAQGTAKGLTEVQLMPQLQPITVETHAIGNPQLNYSVYLNSSVLPGILQLMIFLITVYSIGIEIKERTAREWLKMGGNSLSLSLAGKLLPHTIIFSIIGFFTLVAMYSFAGFPLHSGFWTMCLAMLLLIVASQAVGILMIGILPTLRLGLSFASLFGMLAFSISGFSFPSLAMYPWLQSLAYLFPLRHYFLIYADQALNGREFFYSWPGYAMLATFAFLPFLVLRNLKRALLYFEYHP